MSADNRAVRLAQLACSLNRAVDDVERLVRDAYAEGYRDGLEARDEQCAERVHSRHEGLADVTDLATRRPTAI